MDFIKGFEDCRLKAYPDVGGHPTIGYGHRCNSMSMAIDQTEADRLFSEDLIQAVQQAEILVKAPANDNQWAALTSFIFNLGATNFAESTLLKKLNAGDFAGAADEFLRWDHATIDGHKVVVPGLTRRREAERALFLKGVPMTDVPPALEQHAVVQADTAGKWVPDRKVLAQFAASAVTFGLGWALPAFVGIPVPPDMIAVAAGGIASLVGGAVGYAVPPSNADLMRRAPDTIANLKESAPPS